MTTANIYLGRKRLKEEISQETATEKQEDVYRVHARRVGKKETSISKRIGDSMCC